MTLVDLLLGEEKWERRWFLVLAAILGSSYALAGHIVGQAVNGLPEPPDFDLFAAFLLLVALNLWINGKMVFQIASRVETGVAEIRQDVLEQVRAMDYPGYERVGHDAIYFNLASNVRRISEATALLGRLILNGFGTIGCLVALAVLSPKALLIVVLAMSVVGIVYLGNQLSIGQAQQNATDQDKRYFSGIESLLLGFKELKINRRKQDDFFGHEIEMASLRAEQARVRAGSQFFLNYALFTLLMLISVGSLLYFLPLLLPELADVAIRAAIIAGIIPVSVLRDMPAITRAQSALADLAELKEKLDSVSLPAAEPESDREGIPADQSVIKTLAFEEICFRYTDDTGNTIFAVGPLNLVFKAGEATFITGGNGSGKSTVVRLLTGLYPPQHGRITIDGNPVSSHELQSYITPVFADLHLFDRLYGNQNVDPKLVREWMARLELDGKTEYQDGQFTRVKLSTGQRKRLALISALIEDRPILILDEWAAEQDPEHRTWYYEEFLPMLKAQGRCVIVVSHDDQFFHTADNLLAFDSGKVV